MADSINRIITRIVNEYSSVGQDSAMEAMLEYDRTSARIAQREAQVPDALKQIARSYTAVAEAEQKVGKAGDTMFADQMRNLDAMSSASKTIFADVMKGQAMQGSLFPMPFPKDAPEQLKQVTRSIQQLSEVAGILRSAMEATGLSMDEAAQKLSEGGVFSARQLTQAKQELSRAMGTETAGTQLLTEAQGRLVRQYTELAQADKVMVAQWAKEGLALDQMVTKAKELQISKGQLLMTLRDMGVNVEKLTLAQSKNSSAVYEHIRGQRSMRYGALEMMGAFSLLSISMGETLPDAFKQIEKSSMLITSGGLAAAMAGVNPVVGILGGALLAAGAAMFTLDEATQSLNKSLDSLAKKEDLRETLAATLAITREQADEFYRLAEASPKVAKALKDAVDSQRNLSAAETTWLIVTKSLEADVGFLNQMSVSLSGILPLVKVYEEAWARVNRELQGMVGYIVEAYRLMGGNTSAKRSALDLAKAVEEANARIKEASKDVAKAWTKAFEEQTRASDDATMKGIQNALALSNASRNYAQEKARMEREWVDAQANLAFQNTEKTIARENERARIDRSLREAEARARRELGDREADAVQQRKDREADATHSALEKIRGYYHDLAQEEIRLGEQLDDINRSRADSLEDQSWRKAEALQKAKTWAEVKEINERDKHEKRVIDRGAKNRQDDAKQSIQHKREETAYRISLAYQELEHAKEIARREADQRIAQAKRTFDEQIADARQRNRDEMIDFKNKVLAEDRESQHQYETQKKRYEDQKADAAIRYANEISDIQRRGAIERAEMAQNQFKYWLDWWNRLKMLQEEINKRNELNAIPYGVRSPVSSGVSQNNVGMYFGAQGLDMTVSRPTVIVAGEGGETERVTVTPGSGGSGNVTVQFLGPVYGLTDLDYKIKQMAKQAVERYNTGRK